MSIQKLGLRYERLLFLSAPLSLVSLLVLLVAGGIGNQQDYFESSCYAEAATAIGNHKSVLDNEWLQLSSRIASGLPNDHKYELTVNNTLIFDLHAGSKCFYLVTARHDIHIEPDVLISRLRDLSKFNITKPVNFAGVEIPDRPQIGIFGTTIKIELVFLTQALQIALAPIMLLWLGSLYNTRYREILLVGNARSISDIFPHLVNVYPAGTFLEIRKRTWFRQHVPICIAWLYGIFRAFLLSVFVGPPVAFYLMSLYLLRPPQFVSLFVLFGTVVLVLCVINILIELKACHSRKVFPGPTIIKF